MSAKQHTRRTWSLRALFMAAMLMPLHGLSLAEGEKAEFRIKKFEFRDAKVVDALRLVAELSGVNIVSTRDAGTRELTLFLQDVSVRDAIDTICKVSGLWYREDPATETFRVMTTDEYQKDIVVFREDITRVFTLRHQNVVSAAKTIENLFGDRVDLTLDATGQGGGGMFGNTLGDGGLSGGGLGGSSSGINRRSTNTSFTSDSGERSESRLGEPRNSLQDVKLSSSQLAMLNAGGAGVPQVSEQQLAGLTQREAPIFVTVNNLHNLLFVRTSDKNALTDIEKLILDIDRQPPQVLLEMKILELTLGDSFRSIFDFDYTSPETTAGPASNQPRNPIGPGAGAGPERAFGIGNFGLEGGTFIFQTMNERIRARLQLMQTENRVNVLATPMLLASNNSPARLFIGEERVLTTGVNTSTSTGATGTAVTSISAQTEVRDIGNTLLLLPRINADRTVTLNIQQDSSSVQAGGANIPVAGGGGTIQEFPIDTVNTANLIGTVLAKDGLTVAVGGMIRTNISNSEQKVPLLGDLPLLGYLFKRDVQNRTKTELVLLITPHVFATPDEADERTRARLRSLSRHRYLDQGDRALESEFDTIGADAQRSREVSYNDEDLTLLTRYAAQKTAATGVVQELSGIQPVQIPSAETPLPELQRGARARPTAAWKRSGLYVTAVQLSHNRGDAATFHPNDLYGDWLAATYDRVGVPFPAGTTGEHTVTVVYLVSDRPYLDVLSASTANRYR